MGKTVIYSAKQICRYRTDNPWNQPLGRLSDYLDEFTISPLYYIISQPARLVSMIGVEDHCRVVHETTPFLRLPPAKQLRLGAISCLPPTENIETSLCSLLDFRGWHQLYYHWFLDCLPRIFAAEHHQQRTGSPFKLLLPDRLTTWQQESLHRFGYGNNHNCHPFTPARRSNIRTPCLIASSSHRHQHATQAPFDALSPATVLHLRERLTTTRTRPGRGDLPQRIHITRNRAQSRRLVNEEEVRIHVASRGFTSIDLEDLSLGEQIDLFENASHIIAVHGAGLTNLIYASRASLLEIFSLQHGVRPDYFQIACINGLKYFHHVCPSLNESNDMRLPTSVVDDFLSAAP